MKSRLTNAALKTLQTETEYKLKNLINSLIKNSNKQIKKLWLTIDGVDIIVNYYLNEYDFSGDFPISIFEWGELEYTCTAKDLGKINLPSLAQVLTRSDNLVYGVVPRRAENEFKELFYRFIRLILHNLYDIEPNGLFYLTTYRK